MRKERIVFLGTPLFAKVILKTLIDNEYNVVGVVSQPDKPTGRKHTILPTPVKELALEHGIPVSQPAKLRLEPESVLQYEPDLIITCAYGQIVPEEILQYPKHGCLNIHPSDLPKYRGGAPIQRAIWNGDSKTAICLMEMVKQMDAGRVYAREYVDIDINDTYETLNARLADLSANLLVKYLPEYLEDKLVGEVQDEEKVVLARNISKEEEMVHFDTEDVTECYNHIRALYSDPIAYGIIENKRVKFMSVQMELQEVNEAPGTVLGFTNGTMNIACKNGILKVVELQMEGKSRITADAFKNGAGRQLVGKRFA